MRVAGEIAEREGSSKITIKHIDEANNKIERDKILDIIETQPKQFQAVLCSIIWLEESKDKLKEQKNLVDGESKITKKWNIFHYKPGYNRPLKINNWNQR